MDKCLFGEVSYDMPRCASYVRVSIPVWDGGPHLAVKATPSGFARKLFKKGTVVEVERSNTDGRRFRIVSVFDKVGRNLHEDECECCELEVESERKVRFFIGRRYFGEIRQRPDLLRAINGAFDMSLEEIRDLTACGNGPGFWITCTEAQFARFLISRDREGIPNGFQDLRVDYVENVTTAHREIDVSAR